MTFIKYLHGTETWSLLNILMIFCIKGKCIILKCIVCLLLQIYVCDYDCFVHAGDRYVCKKQLKYLCVCVCGGCVCVCVCLCMCLCMCVCVCVCVCVVVWCVCVCCRVCVCVWVVCVCVCVCVLQVQRRLARRGACDQCVLPLTVFTECVRNPGSVSCERGWTGSALWSRSSISRDEHAWPEFFEIDCWLLSVVWEKCFSMSYAVTLTLDSVVFLSEVRRCSSKPCSGNSTCVETGGGGHVCLCSPGYTGERLPAEERTVFSKPGHSHSCQAETLSVPNVCAGKKYAEISLT